MANQIVQRLVAAGASPDRAEAFAKQFAAKKQAEAKAQKPGRMVGVPEIRPKDIQDAFDAELAAYSAAQWPNTFKPQSLSDAQTIDYFKGIYGVDKYNSMINNTIRTYAPTYAAALGSNNQIIQTAAQAAQSGIPAADSISTVRTLYLNNPSIFGNLTEEDAIRQVTKIYNEYNKAQGQILNLAKTQLNNNKYYKVNLPDPKLKYGETTDLAAGVIGFDTHPSVPGVIQKRQSELAPLPAGAGPLARAARSTDVNIVSPKVLNDLLKTGATPFFDEVTRRESLKKKTTLGQ